MKKKLSLLILVFSLILLPILSPITAKATNKKVLRIGYPVMGNVSKKDADGNYYGYDYEYLKQIAQYTGWEYEFVEVDGDLNTRLMKLLDMLGKGEIDLLGAMSYNDSLADMYDYTSEPYGYTYETLIVKNDSDIYDQNSLISKKEVRVAIDDKSASKAEKLNQFAKMNNFTVKEIRNNGDYLYSLLDEGKADAMLSNDMTIPDGYRIVAKFFPEPFYFATTKGNSDIVSQLNQALISINDANPTFASTLYNRYFTGDNNEFILNNEEKKYVKSNSKLKVLVRDNQAPVQYADGSVIKGVAKDILDNIEKQAGIHFEYTIAKDYNDFKKLNDTGDFDILIGLPYEMKVAETFDITLTNPFLSGNLTLIANNSVDPNHLEDYVEGKTSYTFKEYNTIQRTQSKIYETPEEILLALEKGNDIQYTYLNSYIATYYIGKNSLKNVSTFTVPDYLKSQYSYGVKKTDDFVLLGILNKAIASMDDTINSLIYKNASIEKDFSITRFIQENLAASLVTLFIIAAIVIGIIHRYYTRQLKMKKAVELEYKRYEMLYDMTGEMTFAYNYLTDELKISSSGLDKLATESIIENFSKVHVSQELSNQVTYVIYQYLMKQEDASCEVELTLVNGEKNWYQLTMKIVNDTDKNSQQAVYAIGKVLDIQKVKIEKEILKHNSMTDVLTGIWNRAGAQDKISDRLNQQETRGALVMLDLDNFKEINDQFGHIEGDIVLKKTANILTSVFEDAIVARLGGDEFIIYIEGIDEDAMSMLCKKALHSIEELPMHHIRMTMSMGIAFTDYSHDFEALMKCADERLYEVKRQGKNGFKIYHD